MTISNMTLSDSILKIATTDTKRLRIMAGPGTGKTYALQRRIAYLLEQGQDPTRILVVTFTRNAAKDLIDKLNDLGVDGCKDIRAGTLHSYCFKLLNREEVMEHLKRKSRILMTSSKSRPYKFEGGMLINDLILTQKFGQKTDCVKRIRAFEAAWARNQYETPGDAVDPVDILLKEHLQSWLRFHQAMLVEELVPESLRFLRDNPLSDEHSSFDYIMVDEYQDLNRADQEIIDLLANKCSLTISGDANQSIYRFRYAYSDGIYDFQNRHPMTHDVRLVKCDRCPTRIVAIANNLISKNNVPDSRSHLQAIPTNPCGKISIIQWASPISEANGIAEYVKYLRSNNYEPSDILILTPREGLATEIRNKIEKYGIDTYSFFDDAVLKNESAQRAFALLALLKDKEDRVALRWWLGHKSTTGLSRQYRTLRTYCEASNQSPWYVLEGIDNGIISLSDTERLLNSFRELKRQITHLTTLSNMQDVVDYLLPKSDATCLILREIAEHALANANDITMLFDYIRDSIIHPEIFDNNIVRIMSPQKSKGLTCRVVIVTGCVEELMPGVKPDLSPQETEEHIREARRLFYVAITRCTETLVLSSFTSIRRNFAKRIGMPVSQMGGYMAKQSASQFIGDLGSNAPPSQSGEEWKASAYNEV